MKQGERFEYLERGVNDGTIEERFNESLQEFTYYDTVEDEWLDREGEVIIVDEEDRFNDIPIMMTIYSHRSCFSFSFPL